VSAWYQPTDIAWNKDGSSFAAGGSRPGELNTPYGLVIDNNDIDYASRFDKWVEE